MKIKCDNGYENALEAMQCHILLIVLKVSLSLSPEAYHLTLVTKGIRLWNDGGMWCSHPETWVSRSPEHSVVYLPAHVQLHDFQAVDSEISTWVWSTVPPQVNGLVNTHLKGAAHVACLEAGDLGRWSL